MRTTRLASMAFVTSFFATGVAVAAPTLSLVWTSTTGGGAPGGSTIDAQIGDILEVDVVVTIDSQGFTGAAWDLVGTSALTAQANTLVPAAGGPPECPSPPSLSAGICFSTTFTAFSPLSVGVTDTGSSTTDYDVAGTTPETVPSTMTLGRGVFTVGALAGTMESVSTFFAPGVGGVTNGAFVFSVPPVATASINVLDGGDVDPAEASTTYLRGTTNGSPDTGADTLQPLRIGTANETSFPVNLVNPAEVQVFFTAECAVNSTDDTTWLNVDILIDGVTVAPSNSDEAFCTSSGSGSANRWVSAARDVSTPLPVGLHQVEVRARFNSFAFDPGESWWLDDKSLVVIIKTEDD